MKKLGIVLACVAVLFGGLLLVLDQVATKKAREQADALSKQWGRPVTIGAVSIKLLTGLGVKIDDVQVGAAEGEGAPLAVIKRLEVKAALLKAAFSAGKDVEIRSAELDGLLVNLIRLPDGTTNLSRLQQKISPEPKPEEPAKKESDLSFLRVDHVALREGKIALLDRSAGAEKDLAIEHLELTVNDLRAGKPLEVTVKAAVLAAAQNFELHLKALPLPRSLTPTPAALTLKIQPIDLAPLGPFLGPSVGLQAGKLDADFDMQLGGAVPGGSGPTSVKGVVHALAMRFAGAEGGKSIDLAIDADVKGDAQKGDLAIDRLKVDFGPAGISGTGKAHAVNTSAPQIEGLEIQSHDLDPAKLAAYYPPLKKSLGGEVAGPVGLSLRGAGGKDAQALELKLDLTPVRLSLPGTLAKAAGAAMTLVAHVRGAAASNGPVRFDVAADLTGVDLRPGESVNKAPGQRLDLSVSGTRAGEKIELAELKAHVLADELEGHGKADLSGGMKKFDLSLASSHLDLDALLLPSKPKPDKPPLDPRTFEGIDGHAAVRIDRLTYAKQVMTDLVAEVTMKDDELKVTKAQLKAFGGTADASGTELRLAHPQEPFHAVTHLKEVELENAVALFTPHKLLSGKFNGDIDLKGGGQLKQELMKTLAGQLDGHVLDGNFYGKDLIGSVTGPLTRALPSQLTGKVTQGGTTTLGHDLPMGIRFANGAAELSKPISVTRPEAAMSFTGGIKLDGTLDLPGKIELTPATIAQVTGGKVKVAQNIPFAVRLTGPAWSPQVQELDLKPAIAQIVKEAGAGLLGKALGVDNLDQKKEQVQAQAQQEAQQAQQRAQEAAKKAQQNVQDEAAKRLKGLFGK